MIKVDAMGLSCPIPVVMAKKALKELDGNVNENQIIVSVDNKTSAENLEKLARSLKYEFDVKKVSEYQYDVVIAKGDMSAQAELVEPAEPAAPATPDGAVVVISSEKMGEGDDDLGKSLMKAFVYALTEADSTPSKIILYNGGVKLNAVGAPTAGDLSALSQKGAQVFSCGACLNHYGLTESIATGEITNMYTILEMMNNASKIIRP